MKRLTVLSVFLAALLANSFAQVTRRVLFLGNSYTYVNNLPQMLADLADSAGDSLIFDGNNIGGYRLMDHSSDAASLSKIDAGNWDFVVLQEQSQLPSFSLSQVKSNVFPYARFLDSLITIKNPCAETIFYMTWGRKNGDASNCSSWPPVCTYRGMDSLLSLRYRMMADSNDAILSPVGAVWKYIRQNHPLIDLYQFDESHPSLAGSYAAACSFYATVFRKDPTLIADNYGLSPTDAANIRLAARTVVYNNLLSWHIGEYDPVADFSASAPVANTVTFNNQSVKATSYLWDFGDGVTSATFNPTHTYTASGTFTVSLTASHCVYTSVKLLAITFTLVPPKTGITTVSGEQFRLYPVPVADKLSVEMEEKIEGLTVVNSLGQSDFPVHTTNAKVTSIDFSGYPPGVYTIIVRTNNHTFRQQVIK